MHQAAANFHHALVSVRTAALRFASTGREMPFARGRHSIPREAERADAWIGPGIGGSPFVLPWGQGSQHFRRRRHVRSRASDGATSHSARKATPSYIWTPTRSRTMIGRVDRMEGDGYWTPPHDGRVNRPVRRRHSPSPRQSFEQAPAPARQPPIYCRRRNPAPPARTLRGWRLTRSLKTNARRPAVKESECHAVK
jgi:hypothetical protein